VQSWRRFVSEEGGMAVRSRRRWGKRNGEGRIRVSVHSELERTRVVTTNLVFLAGGRPT